MTDQARQHFSPSHFTFVLTTPPAHPRDTELVSLFPQAPPTTHSLPAATVVFLVIFLLISTLFVSVVKECGLDDFDSLILVKICFVT